MERKYMIIIAAIVVIAALIAVVFATGVFNQSQTTPFETDFMSGTFVGNVSKADTNVSYVASYSDKENNITYNLTTVDNSSALMEIYKFQGVTGPEYRSYNGNEWNVYFAEAMSVLDNQTNQSTPDSQKPMGIIICESQQEGEGYVVYVIFEDTSKVNFTMNTFGDAYVNHIEPLLNSLSLKKIDNVPAVNEEFGLTPEEFDQQIQMIRQVMAGNYTG